MKRILDKLVLILIVVTLLPLQYIGSIAKAEEHIKNGNYEVELHFLLIENDIQENVFEKHAKLAVKDGQSTLVVPMIADAVVMTLNATQQDESILTELNRDKNIAQFELNSIQGKILVKGTAKSKVDGEGVSFTQEFNIASESLPKEEPEVEQPEPEPEPEPEAPTPPVVEEEDQEKPDIENPLEYKEINYILLTDGKKEPSIMNTYVNPVMKIKKKKGGYVAQMEILKSSWITGLKIEQNGKMVEPKEISLVENKRVIQFDVKDLHRKVRLWVKVEIPEISYAHDYFVDLLFDPEQANGIEGPGKVEEPEKDPIQKPTQTIPNQLQSSGIKVPPKSFKSPSLPRQKASIRQTISKPPVVVADEQLAFDRTLDDMSEDEKIADKEAAQEREVTQPVNQVNQETTPFDKVKIGVLVSLLLLSGVLLIRRFKNRKIDSASGE